jgi:Flp pilus assembly protein TadB
MRGDGLRRASRGVGALTRKDRYREAALARKAGEAHRSVLRTSSTRKKRQYLRAARKHERALDAQRRRPQSIFIAFAVCLVALLVLNVSMQTSWTLTLVLGGLLVADLRVLRRRRRRLRKELVPPR